METTHSATKCIAIDTPFGFMYLEQKGTFYDRSRDVVTTKSFDAKVAADGYAAITPINDKWVAVSTGGHWPIVSNYGDEFPNG